MRMLVLGDSVPWVQGLLDVHKYSALVEAALPAEFHGNRVNLSHSGATIGQRTQTISHADGEVPISWPTVRQQVEAGEPTDVELVLMNGGINDVDIRNILNPCTDSMDLRDDIHSYCYQDYLQLLAQARTRFPNAWIVTTGYYPILSEQSDWNLLFQALPSFGIANNFVAPRHSVLAKIVALSEQFAEESETALKQAVTDARDVRSIFVPLGFGPENAVFAKEALLFGLQPTSLAPEDEVIPQRTTECMTYFHDPLDVFSLFQCIHASVGHPNVEGAAAIANEVNQAITRNCQFK
jgi:lysophospholipase L1-like esterase